jgi:hypothetical protein
MAGKSCRSRPSAGRDTTGKDACEQMAWYRSTNCLVGPFFFSFAKSKIENYWKEALF